jgi:hypothetical protein
MGSCPILRRFDSGSRNHYYAPVAQLEEVLDLDSRGCRFESDQGHQLQPLRSPLRSHNSLVEYFFDIENVESSILSGITILELDIKSCLSYYIDSDDEKTR